MKKTLIKNLITILLLDLVVLPLAVGLYLTHGFNVVHVLFFMAYIYGVALVYKTAIILTAEVKDNEFSQEEMDFIDEEFAKLSSIVNESADKIFNLKK